MNNPIYNYRQSTPKRRKLFWVLVLLIIPLASAAFILSLSGNVHVINPFNAKGPFITSSSPGNAILAGQNFTGTWIVSSTFNFQTQASIMPDVSNSTALSFYGSWPQTLIIPAGSTTNETVLFHASFAGDYKVSLVMTWLP